MDKSGFSRTGCLGVEAWLPVAAPVVGQEQERTGEEDVLRLGRRDPALVMFTSVTLVPVESEDVPNV